ncbi:MAG: hypothetical protein KDI19_00465 [Pseudomonadales bacterium]|nr:hypothetical protein [Pseudomonadales bacterium]
MARVKGTRQYQMVVVPHRPWYRVGVFLLVLVALAAGTYLAWRQGKEEGMATRIEVVKEKDRIEADLEDSRKLIERQRQEIADLKVGGEIDSRANEEVRQTVESLQSQIAELNEEIRFYKGIMLPNVEDKGLRIERLDLKKAGEPDRYRYSLLLTQVVDKHDYIQGGVQISVIGVQDEVEKTLPLDQISDASNSIKFRFRYFQNIDGELTVPAGFVPREVSVVAQASGGGQRLERKFQWQTGGG